VVSRAEQGGGVGMNGNFMKTIHLNPITAIAFWITCAFGFSTALADTPRVVGSQGGIALGERMYIEIREPDYNSRSDVQKHAIYMQTLALLLTRELIKTQEPCGQSMVLGHTFPYLSISLSSDATKSNDYRNIGECAAFLKSLILDQSFEPTQIINALKDSAGLSSNTYPGGEATESGEFTFRKLAYLAAGKIYSKNTIASHLLSIDNSIIRKYLSNSTLFFEWLSLLRKEPNFELHFSNEQPLRRPKKLEQLSGRVRDGHIDANPINVFYRRSPISAALMLTSDFLSLTAAHAVCRELVCDTYCLGILECVELVHFNEQSSGSPESTAERLIAAFEKAKNSNEKADQSNDTHEKSFVLFIQR
jgi:hypothetical protein